MNIDGRPVAVSRKLAIGDARLRIVKLDNHRVSRGAGNRGIN